MSTAYLLNPNVTSCFPCILNHIKICLWNNVQCLVKIHRYSKWMYKLKYSNKKHCSNPLLKNIFSKSGHHRLFCNRLFSFVISFEVSWYARFIAFKSVVSNAVDHTHHWNASEKFLNTLWVSTVVTLKYNKREK